MSVIESMHVRLTTLTLAGLTWLAPGAAQAQATARDAPGAALSAQALFDEADQLLASHRFDEACEKLEVSQALDPAAGTLLNLARCYEGQGKLATAWLTYQRGVALAQRSGRESWAALGARRMAALEPKVPRVLVRAGGTDTEVSRNGTPLAASELGLAIPVDPGELHLEADGPGKRTWRRDVTVGVGEHLVIDVGALEDDAPRTAAPASRQEPIASLTEGGSARALPVQRYVAIGVAGLGVIGIGVGAAFGMSALAKRTEAASLCPHKSQCTDALATRAADDARSASNVATGGFIAGAALLASAVIVYFTAPATARPRSGGDHPTWHLAVHPGGVHCAGTF